MDMSSMSGMDAASTSLETISMAMPVPSSTTATSGSDMAMSTSTGSMESMSNMVGSAGEVCQIQMLWNWNTIGACFITPQWQVASRGGMIGTCFGAVFLVMALEMLRRATKEFDRWLIRRHNRAAEAHYRQISAAAPSDIQATGGTGGGGKRGVDVAQSRNSSITVRGSCVGGSGDVASGMREHKRDQQVPGGTVGGVPGDSCYPLPPCRPNVLQQGVRALLHAAQFTAAYFIMMLVMNYNGFIIISIIIGAYLGSFLFSWETLSEAPRSQTSASEEATVCCA